MLEFFQEKKYFIAVLLIFIIFTVITGQKKEQNLVFEEENRGIEKEIVEEKKKVFIHIAGNVGKPGLFQMEEGSRLNDLIIPGEIKDLEILDKYFNRAELLYDGQKIYIPFPEEIDDNLENNLISQDSKGSEKININKASMEELIKLPGIGQVKAGDIISFREKNGKFKNIDDIILVKGIGQATFDKIKELIKT